jgi:predicted ATPase/DNA-binding winged helix-turn-helix (wHTH) protein
MVVQAKRSQQGNDVNHTQSGSGPQPRPPQEIWNDPGDAIVFGDCTLSPARRALTRLGVNVELGERAFDLLLSLVESRGSIVSKDQLMSKVWPGRIVEENTLEGQMSLLRRALGDDRNVIRTIAGRGYQFIGEVRAGAAPADASPAAPGLAPVPSTLPACISQLIGRETALAEIAELSQSSRLITLVGTGGVGKTRLAIEAARTIAGRFRDGVFFAELASVASPDLLLVALSQALGYSPGDGVNSLERIGNALHARQLLLVLDNCEHLVDAIAQLVERLLRAAPAIDIIATSREALRAEGEYVYRVASLEIPVSEQTEPSELARYGALRLFEARLGHTGAGEDHAASAQLKVRICRRLDGIPLALELAAARVAVLGLQGVADRLDDRFQLLTHGARTALPRQQTLRATLDWSYDLLAPVERAVLARLGVFATSFDVDAAQFVAADGQIGAEEVFESVAGLVTKSLLVPDLSGRASRFRLLETTRVYAREKLLETGEGTQVSLRHASYFLTLFERCAGEAAEGMSADCRSRYAAHLEDFRLAVGWAFAGAGHADIGVRLTIAWLPLALQLGLLEECLARVDTALSWLPPGDADSERSQMKLYTARGAALLFRTGGEATGIAFRLALEIADRIGDAEYQKRGVWGSWCYAYLNGRYDEALRLAERFHALALQQAHRWDELTGKRILGITHLCLGNLDASRSFLESMLAGHPRDASRAHRVRFLYDEKMLAHASLAQTLWLLGLPDQAMAVALRSRQDAVELDHAPSLCFALSEAVCVIALLNGDRAALADAVTELTVATRRHGVSTWKARARMWAALPLLEQGQVEVYEEVIAPALAEIGDAQFFISLTPFLCAVGICLGEQGCINQGLALVGPAIARASINKDSTSLIELSRVNALLLLMRGGADAEKRAGEQLMAALASAREQGFLAWELRCALSLCALWRRQGRADGAVLASAYARFSEGFDTADLTLAKSLMSDEA